MNAAERYRLLHGPYHPPALRKGDRATCLYRDSDVIITGWSHEPISWPRCRALGTKGGSGLLVDEELARAVRCESALANRYLWGVSAKAVWNWRKALGVGRMDSEGSRRLILDASHAGADALKRNGLTKEQCRRAGERAKRLNLIRYARAKPARLPWTAAEEVLLGTAADSVVARGDRTQCRGGSAEAHSQWHFDQAGPATAAGRQADSRERRTNRQSGRPFALPLPARRQIA